MKKLCVFDIEVMKNCFICCCKANGERPVVFEISARKFQLKELHEFFTSGKYNFVGYNCSGYDTPIMNMLFQKIAVFLKGSFRDVTMAAYELSSSIVGKDTFASYRYRYLKFFKDIDLMTMMASKALRVGLKSLQVTMCYPNVKEMVIQWSEDIELERIDEVISYCFNDISSTQELYNLVKNDFQLRMQIQKEFKIECLSKDGVGIGVDIFTKFVCDKLQCHPKQLPNYVEVPKKIIVAKYIDPLIQFKTPQFQELLRWYKSLEISIEEHDEEFRDQTGEDDDETEEEEPKTKYKKTIRLNKLSHTFALGGVHSVNKPNLYVADGDYYLIDKDVESYYPSLALAYLFGPAGFLDEFLAVMQFLKDERVVAKKNGDKLKNESYKLALNSILGNLKNKYSPYYAPQANVAICVNGQLMIAMLIEDCELAGIECISSNTDGATFKVHKSKLDLFEKLCSDWSKLTRMKLEDSIYEKMVIYAVNDYIAYKTGYKDVDMMKKCEAGEIPHPQGYKDIRHQLEFVDPYTAIHDPKHPMLELANKYIKEKGMFITVPRLGKGLDALIVPKMLQAYYGKGDLIKETLEKATTIWDFIKFQKIGKQFRVIWKEQEQQHINRFYVSKHGAYLYKEKYVEKYNKKTGQLYNVRSLSNVLKGFGVQLINEFEQKPIEDYKIQYNYYLKQANEIIRKLEPEQQKLF